MSDNTDQTGSGKILDLCEAYDALRDAKLAIVIALANEARDGDDEVMLDRAIELLSGPSTFDQEEEEQEAKAA